MKTIIIRHIFMLLGIGGCTISSKGQATIQFFFIAPTASITSNFGAQPATTLTPAGYSIVEITAANSAKFSSVAPPRIKYVYDQLQAGRPLRQKVDKVLKISGNTISLNYYLMDDRNGFNAGSTGIFLAVPFASDEGYDGKKHVWPTGGSGGRIRLGEYQMENDQSHRAGGVAAIDELVLHETTHTQFTGSWSKWDGYITYGADESHYGNELQGDREAAFNEGIATFYGFTLNAAGITELNNFHGKTDDRYFVEAQSVLAGEKDLYSITGRKAAKVRNANVFRYTWLQLPGFYIPFSERTSTAYFTYFWQNVNGNKDEAFDMIVNASNAMYSDRKKRFLDYTANRLALLMEAYAITPAGQAAKTNGTLTSSLFPFALFDLLTHFGMTETEFKEDYERKIPDKNPKAYTSYWAHRTAIKNLVQADLAANPIRFTDAVKKIHDYCRQPANIIIP
ncbi:MAG TPA: hypothetical protein VFV79_05390 [Saprospiraceae bacterium]|nr:hypothetical protein [Saprospiraceae bacterium]